MAWKKKIGVRGPNVHIRTQREIQHMHVFWYHFFRGAIRVESIRQLREFILTEIGNEIIGSKFRKYSYNIRWVYWDFRNQFYFAEAKVEALKNYWDKIVIQIRRINKQQGCAQTALILKELSSVDPKIQHYVLHQYIKRCKELYQIMFYQWRNLYPAKYNTGS